MSTTRNPEDVHPEYDRPTPENAEEWSDEQIEAFNEAKRGELQSALEEETGLSEAEEQARDALMEAGRTTETVDLHGVELEVLTELPGTTEQTLRNMDPEDRVDDTIESVLDVFAAVVVGPEGYGSRRAWKDVYDTRGSVFLREALEVVTEPAYQRIEGAESFREE